MQLMDTKHKLLDYKRNISDLEKQLLTSLDNKKPIDHLEEAREILVSLQELNYENTHLILMLSGGHEADMYNLSGLEHRVDRFFSEFGKLRHVFEQFLEHCAATTSEGKEIW